MRIRIQQTTAASSDAMDYVKTLRTQQMEWTIKSLGIKLEESSSFTKQDGEHDDRSNHSYKKGD